MPTLQSQALLPAAPHLPARCAEWARFAKESEKGASKTCLPRECGRDRAGEAEPPSPNGYREVSEGAAEPRTEIGAPMENGGNGAARGTAGPAGTVSKRRLSVPGAAVAPMQTVQSGIPGGDIRLTAGPGTR
jgi:hypothetical protein